MKRSILMWAVLTVAAAALAQPPNQPPAQPQTSTHSLSATVKKPAPEKKVEVFTPQTKKSAKPTDKVERVDGISSQPWTKTVGTRPGWSAFGEPENRDAAFDVLWIGAPPSH